ncbi:putative MATE family efflux protein [Desulfitobacterium sp. LBE]|uniref:Multidrug export protein MepA n=5 Tax=root TaxID=1 RepID=Q24XD4_DESHY|nr:MULTISPECIES: MATE family efflux transporter [Desulfitobacterium]ACL20677.1 MATE efflux family protein [Desulfitobacterium hafniense DCB-2]EHL07240.1 MATE efflux family protein [Desulfitobacterium hafniense DP7]KTE90966.1 MATE family efflux transporter [Desulfitobacterium hafniense]MEA5024805.1 MATE family efflux transporter [Desulfitobacterium hafniense]TWH56495.1 putative MATE family efflux protein [Desulfitobacterium sp. LBE]
MISLRNDSIGKLLWEFSLPAIIGMLVNALYNIIGRIFVGQGVGYLAIAAVTVAMPVMILLMSVAMLVGVGATALISIRMGEKKMDEVEKIAGNATGLLVLLPLLLSFVYFFNAEPLLVLFGASPEVLPYAKEYSHIIMMGAVPGALAFGMNNFIRAEGNPRIAMLTQIIGAVINIVCNYIYIFIFDWGIQGSALATVTGQTVSAIWVLSHFLMGRSRIKLRAKYLRLDPSIVLKTITIGFAPFAMQIANSVQQTLLNNTLREYGGDIAISAVGIVMSISMLLLMPIVGVSQGAQPIIGYNYGAQNYERVKETLKKAVLVGTAMAAGGFVLLHLFAVPVVGLFSKNDLALTELAVHASLVFLALMPIVGFQIIGSSYFQAVGKPIQSTILSLSRQVLLFIPLLLLLPRFYKIEGVWITAPIADGLAVLVTGTFLFFELRKYKKPVPALGD